MLRKDTVIRLLVLIIIILLALLVRPYFHVSTTQEVTSFEASSTNLTNPTMPGMVMASFPLDSIDTSSSVPTISFTMTEDSVDGWDIHLITNNFTFTPENIDQAPVPNEGHAHLYIDGQLTIVLAPWVHINTIPKGEHTITISLNTNNHEVFTYNNQKIESTQTIDVK